MKLAEQQINRRQAALGSLQHQIGYSNVSVQINSGGLLVVPVLHQAPTSCSRSAAPAMTRCGCWSSQPGWP